MNQILTALWIFVVCSNSAAAAAVYQGNGFKIGEVDQTSAVVWTRLTPRAEALWDGIEFIQPEVPLTISTGNFDWRMQIPEGTAISSMQGAMSGAPGEVRITLIPDRGGIRKRTRWLPVDPRHDYVRQVRMTGLSSACHYRVLVESRDASGASGPALKGEFTTAPAARDERPIRFVAATCGDFPRRDDPANGHRIYQSMLKLNPQFFVHTGDLEYFDKPTPVANSPALARFKFNRLFALPFNRTFHLSVPSYFLPDDHDILKNDCWPGQTYGELTFAEGLQIFREQTPSPTALPYRTVRWGRHLQLWFMEGREFRSANTNADGPDKTIWGKAQKAWLFHTVGESDATFKILFSPTPIAGPDRAAKGDNHANDAFQTEGNEIRRFIGSRRDMIVICGDRHWQYASIHPATGVREFGSGPSTDVHAGGYTQQPGDDQIQKFFRLKGGFLSGEVQVSRDKAPSLTVRHHDVAGNVVHETPIFRE